MRLILFFLIITLNTYAQDHVSNNSCERPSQDIADQLLSFAQTNIAIMNPLVQPPHKATKGQMLTNGNYRSRHGLIIHANCLNKEGITIDSIEKSIDDMAHTAERCGNRMAPYTRALFNSAFAEHPEFSCDFKKSPCSERAHACYDQNTKTISFKSVESIHNPSTLFHEMLHMAGVDNQQVQTHNSVFEDYDSMINDEVYFWQRVCFSPTYLLVLMRSHYPSRNICERPLKHHQRPSRVRHHQSGVNQVCGFFGNYIHQERKFMQNIRENLFPMALKCEVPECPDLESITTKLKNNGAENLAIPPIGEIVNWIKKNSYFSVTSEDRITPWRSLFAYLVRNIDNFTPQKLMAKGLNEKEAQSYAAYIEQVDLKVRYLYNATRFEDFPSVGTKEQQAKYIKNLIENCRENPKLHETELCQNFSNIAGPQIAELLSSW